MDSDHFLIASPSHPPEPTLSGGLHLLTAREREVVLRALRGCANKVIAFDLGLAHSTVRVLIARAASKLGVRTREELLEIAGALLSRDEP
ncbi:MAG: helix-turn-helix transcriptional regulator [Polyangiaceae bacterium]|jgi:DNA-binding NarL/FixJ family response regulator